MAGKDKDDHRNIEALREVLREINPDMVLFDDMDSAVVGVVRISGVGTIACYDMNLAIQSFMSQGMSREEAQDWVEFNVLDAYVGEFTPAFLIRVGY